MAWPSIAKPTTMTESSIKGQIKSAFSSGYVQSRAKFTRERKQFQLIWHAMTDADKATLLTYFDNNLGGTFTWTEPLTSTSYTVRFSDEQLVFNRDVSAVAWQISLTLEEQ